MKVRKPKTEAEDMAMSARALDFLIEKENNWIPIDAPKTRMDKVHCQHIHIDNGGISMSVEDTGKSINFEISAQYFGYPAISASMNIQDHAIEFVSALRKLADSVEKDIENINWQERYE